MDYSQEEFLRNLLSDFRSEATEHISSIEEGLFAVENDQDKSNQASVLEKIYRDTHSLKGAARAVSFTETEKICMRMESLFNSLKRGKIRPVPDIFDAMHLAISALRKIINSVDSTGQELKLSNIQQIIRSLEFAESIGSTGGENLAKEDNKDLPDFIIQDSPYINPVDTEAESVRISSAHLNKILRGSEDLISVKTTLEYYWNTLREMEADSRNPAFFELVEDLSRFKQIAGRMIDSMIHEVKQTLLMPFSGIAHIIHRVVRDVAKDKKKQINVKISGELTEIDRRILEILKDPMIHLLRNCADHGIETPEKRREAGKDPVGTITVDVTIESGTAVIIRIKDDGAGLDFERIRESAVKNGVIEGEKAQDLTQEELTSLIFYSGVSSSQIITEVSGRGLGMAIVADKIRNAGGEITVYTENGSGTEFIIRVPQSVATFRGILVSCAGQTFIIPSFSVEKSVAMRREDIKEYGNKKVIFTGDSAVGIAPLCNALDISSSPGNYLKVNHIYPVLLLKSGNRRFAFIVDEVFGETECIVKSLGSQLKHVTKISGATLTSNGVITLIINTEELINDLFDKEGSKSRFDLFTSKPDNTPAKRVLVAEDSITVRNMLKSILESAGYETRVAVDGADAFDLLERENFDLLVSDIEMPNMNGFELTAKIRSHSKFSNLPVVLVTSLESGQDVEKGLRAGANAYIVKGSFEKNNLVDTIRRLI
jgi:two-component system chemotaxis sensor kinase CheA